MFGLIIAIAAVDLPRARRAGKIRPLFGVVAQLGERRVRNAEVGSSILLHSTKIQRPTVLGWAFPFLLFARHAGVRAILRVPATSGTSDLIRPVRPCSALSFLETCANRLKVAHADGVVCQ